MGTKNNPGVYDCLSSLAPDEPYFVLVAHDALAPSLIRSWAQSREHQIQAGVKPPSDMAKVAEAKRCAADMELWRANEINKSLQQPKTTPDARSEEQLIAAGEQAPPTPAAQPAEAPAEQPAAPKP